MVFLDMPSGLHRGELAGLKNGGISISRISKSARLAPWLNNTLVRSRRKRQEN